MKMLNLTIDLPKTAYSITDKPSLTQKATNALQAIFSTILLSIAMVGIVAIWAVNVIGSGLEWALNVTEWMLQTGDNFIIVVIAAIAGLLMGRIRDGGLCRVIA